MFKLTIDEKTYSCQPDETVLDVFLREEVNISYACKKGTCHSCMVRSPDVQPPKAAQVGLKDTLKIRNHFLACLWLEGWLLVRIRIVKQYLSCRAASLKYM